MPAVTPNPSAVRMLSLGLTPGKLRGLQRISNANGTLTMVATDQNSSMISMLKDSLKKRGEAREPTFAEIVEAKLDLLRALGPVASGVLVDAYYGVWNAVASLSMPRNTGLLVRVEKSGGPKNAVGAPLGEIEVGWSVAKIKRMGGDAVKLLAQFEPTEPDSAEKQFAFMHKVYQECLKHDILLVLETVSFPFKQGDQAEDKKSESYLNRKAKTVIETARLVSGLCDIYKAEFPGTSGRDPDGALLENLQKLDEASARPWVLLSAGVDFPDFKRQMEMAAKAGCSGCLGGRAFWKEYFTFDKLEERQRFARQQAASRVREIHEIVTNLTKPWFARYGLTLDQIGEFRAMEGWQFRYGEYTPTEQGRGAVSPGDVY
jgi:tagatose 1,6-diphosphate aldolase